MRMSNQSARRRTVKCLCRRSALSTATRGAIVLVLGWAFPGLLVFGAETFSDSPQASALSDQTGDLFGNQQIVQSFDGPDLPANMRQNDTRVRLVPHQDGQGLLVHFGVTDWPNVFFTPPQGTVWDWSAHAGLAFDLHNPGSESISVSVRVDNEGADGLNHCNTGGTVVGPGESTTLWLHFRTPDSGKLWGMRGLPERGPLGDGSPIDTKRIVAYQVFLPRPDRPYTLLLANIRLFGFGGDLDQTVPMPFVDRFGQYKHSHWPGKLLNERELVDRRNQEAQQRDRFVPPPDQGDYGGWTEGPRREATGFFRTEKIDGIWWLVTPQGHLFLSIGMDCVGTWERTFIEGRDDWFEWLPDDKGSFRHFLGYAQNAHSMADPIDGRGRTFSFYGANLIRKYGETWATDWRNVTYQRLQAWGFNTIGNWSQSDVIQHSPMPFVVSANITGVAPLEGGTGYWAPMIDVFAPEFSEAVGRSVAFLKRYAEDPRLLGVFVDNELAWHGLARGALNSPESQPARQAFIADLQAKYSTLAAVNDAWGTEARQWSELRIPARPHAAATADIEAFEGAFARRYFETVRAALQATVPNHLYLGARFAGDPGTAVLRACADVADVVSFNIYARRVPSQTWIDAGWDRPVMIGEFHFGALDRGMFHTGLVPTRNQDERAAAYQEYIRSVARCPLTVGAHWFQYIDEPITGRFFDGENYNIGFVDVTDTPYPELVEAARQINRQIYPLRAAIERVEPR